ncbi:type II/IV secretion system ATPase subunit [Candidatus Woesearchaeota archaeon]|nr:type II/IV secretion system ATPase subunit [Candidatus Woesearchaeota archaeon]
MTCGEYTIVKEGDEIIARVDAEDCPYFPSIEDEPRAMARAIEILAESDTVTKIVFMQKRDIEYEYDQVNILKEVAAVFKRAKRYKFLDIRPECAKWSSTRTTQLQELVMTLKTDPLGAYVTLKRIEREEKAAKLPREAVMCLRAYNQALGDIIKHLERTQIVEKNKDALAGHKPGDRAIYRQIFSPTIKPDFMFTKLMASYPSNGTEIASYQVGETEVTIFEFPDSIQYRYHIVPPEFKLSEDRYELLDAARTILAEHKPTRSEFTDPERMRQVFTSVSKDLLDELSEQKGIHLRQKERDQLADILVRYTVGFGLIEVLLSDDKIQDIVINSPMGRTPMFIVHGEFGDCATNIIPTVPEGESWASKLRMISGRPLDEANPILDAELVLPQARARVAAITSPLNPTGIAYALRRHRDRPWTLPLFMKNKMIDSMAAGLISFLVDGNRTMLVAGTRSAGKTSLLGSVMTELNRRNRVVTIEDTLELPVNALRKLEYNIQSMKVASALTRGTTEVSADEGIRTTLRLGDSALIVGEVRSTEAKALYEAMRVGALANTVAGTIHGDSPYGVYDRVVNDLGVVRTSFKATDIIIVANPIRSPDGIHRVRRVTQITEVRKEWTDDPLREGGFVDLMKYDPETDQLQPTNALLRGDSEVVKSIGGTIKEWAGDWDAIWDNIMLRAKMKQALLDTSIKLNKPSLLEAGFAIEANDQFHKITEQVKEDTGKTDSKKIFFSWNEWLKRATR